MALVPDRTVTPVILVGTKSDMKHVVPIAEVCISRLSLSA
jgi:hypothetical protein